MDVQHIMAQLKQEIKDLETELENRRQFLAWMEQKYGSQDVARKRVVSIDPSSSLAENLVEIMDAGKPMRIRDITKKAEQAGITTLSASGLGLMVTKCLNRRTDIFRKTARGTFKLIQNNDLR